MPKIIFKYYRDAMKKKLIRPASSDADKLLFSGRSSIVDGLVKYDVKSDTEKARRLRLAHIIKRSYSFAGRQKSTKVRMLFKQSSDRRFSSGYSARTGRGSNGSMTVYTKGSGAKRKHVLYANSLSQLKYFVIALKAFKDPRSSKVAVVLSSSSGSLITLPLTNRVNLLSPNTAAQVLPYIRSLGFMILEKFPRLCEFIYMLSVHRAVCYVSSRLGERATLCKSSGSRAVIIKLLKSEESPAAVIRLPSGDKKFIDAYNIVLLGQIAPRRKKAFKNTRAGYWRNIGSKPTVRGVVKNPVDHPHGGRTKTVLWPRTPWGKSAK